MTQPFPAHPIYDQLIREQEQQCTPDPEAATDPEPSGDA